MTSLFLNTSITQNCQLDCPSLNISDTIERECLSVLHKLHDQVNGLQLVQVVVQPLAKLFNPASLAALAATNPSLSHHNPSQSPPSYNVHGHQTSGSHHHSNASTPSTQYPPPLDHDPTATITPNSASVMGLHGPGGSSHNHSRSHSVASSFATTAGHSQNSANVSGTSSSGTAAISSVSTYMMSPDTAQALIARLDTDRDVNWLMEIIGYGLSMPFSLTGEQDSVKDCCTIYCEWLAAALLPYDEYNEDTKYQQLSRLVPVPIRKDPNRYARKILSHLYNVFLPRQPLVQAQSANYHTQSPSANANLKNTTAYQKDEPGALLAAVSRQAVLCHRVLRTIESIAHNQANLMDTETWQHLLALLLTVNDKLLSPPTEPDDIGTQLNDRILGVLFDLMLLASSRSIPDASLWKNFHEMCTNWRHRPALVDHWRRITALLTKRIATTSAGVNKSNESTSHEQSYSQHIVSRLNNPIESSAQSMNYEVLSQSWYRFLTLIGNPVELTDQNIISRTDEFYHAACLANSVLDPRQHPCLNVLPQIFLNSMLGLKDYIDLFISCSRSIVVNQQQPPSSQSRTSAQSAVDQANLLSSSLSQLNLSPDRPKCNSILHIFGDWLFSAALIGSELAREIDGTDESSVPLNLDPQDAANMTESTMSVASSTTTTTATESGFPGSSYSPLFARRQSHQSNASSHTSLSTNRTGRRNSKQLDMAAMPSEKITLEPPLSVESFEAGQAEAMAALCKIFTSKSPTEDILPTYLARFYLCLQHCLSFGSGQDPRDPDQTSGPIKRQLLASVLMNSTSLLQRDLDGINLLIPSFIKAIEIVLECSEKGKWFIIL